MSRSNVEHESEASQSGSSGLQSPTAQNLDSASTVVQVAVASPEHDMALTVVANDPATLSLLEALAVRMADEKIPVRAIARTTRLPSDEVYAVLRNAIGMGQIIEMPRDDWPVENRGNRVQAEALQNEDNLRAQLSLKFKVTKQESAILAALLKRDFVTKDQLHQIMEAARPGPIHNEQTAPKQIDVLMCKIRKKIKSFNIEIETIWNTGYAVSREHSEKAIQLLQLREAA
jgi:DNA-binding winged helix-turn-helix (wHTH) protein